MMQSLGTNIASPSVYLPTFTILSQISLGNRRLQHTPYGLRLPSTQSQAFQKKQAISFTRRLPSTNATCAAAQTQSVQHQSSMVTTAPVTGKEKLQKLDDGGSGLPPRDDGGGGGGGGGGHQWSGGFYFFAVLVFLNYLKDLESEEPDSNRR